MAEKHHNAEERESVSRQICEYIEDGKTLESACKAAGITSSTFRRWRREFPEISDMYEVAYARWLDGFKEDLRDKCQENLMKRVTGYTITNVRYEATRDENGEIVKGKPIHVDEREYGPDQRALEFSLTNIAPADWKHRQDVKNTHIGGIPSAKEIDLERLSDEELEQYSNLIAKAAGNGEEVQE